MRASILIVALAVATISGAPVLAQENAPLVIPADAVEVSKGNTLNFSTTYIVPGVHLFTTANGSLFVTNGKAQAKGKFFTDGLTQPMLEDLALKIQNDLVAKLRAAGYTVLTFDDIKSEPDMLKREVREPNDNPKYGGMATWKHASGRATYVVTAPTGPQNLKPVLQGPTWGLRNIAKDKNAVLIVPEYYFDTPQMIGEKESGYKRDKAGINVRESLNISWVNVWTLTGKGGGGLIQIKNPVLASSSVGQVEMQGDARGTDIGDWKRSSGDFVMSINPAAFTQGMLRGGYAINDAVVAAAVKEKK